MILADTEAACLYTGRTRETLYRWAREGRIHRYGARARRLWDLDELPGRVPGQFVPEPPERRVGGKQLSPYVVDDLSCRTDSTPPTLTERLGGREAAMAAMYGKLDEEQRPERERKEREDSRLTEKAERRRIAGLLGCEYPEGAVVYYLRFCCRVKIGTSTNLMRRLIGVPHDELLAVESGDRELETLRHREFSANRIKGEWFDMTPSLFQHILDLRGGKPWTHMPDSWIRSTQPST